MSWRGALRGLGRVVTLLSLVAVVLIAAAASLWWWSGTQGSLDWAWQRYAQPMGLQGEGVTGSLRRGLRAQRLQWSQDGLSAQLQGVDIGWQPLELVLQRRLRLTHVRAATVSVDDRRPATVSQPPVSLALPLEVTADDILIGQLRWEGATPFEAADLSAQYRYSGGEHHLGLRNARVADGRYRGEVRLGGAAPLALNVRLQGTVRTPVPGRGAPLALALDASAHGSLADISLQAQLRTVDAAPAASAPTADLTARVTPWGQPLLGQAQARLQSIDLAALWPQALRTDLHGRIDFAPGAAGTWNLTADLANRRPGPWDGGQLPLSRLQGRGEWRDGTALVREFVVDLGGGRAEGRGEWLEGQAWRAEAQLRSVRPGQLHTALASAPVSGRLQAQGRGQAVSFSADLQAQGQGAPAEARLLVRQLQASGRLEAGRLSLASFMARTDDARLDGALDLDLSTRAGQGRATLAAPGLQARAEGALAPTTGRGTLTLDVAQLAQARQWLERLPGLRTLALPDLPPADGDARLALEWQGGWRSPRVQAQLAGQVRQDQRQLRLDLAAQAAGETPNAWSGRIDTLQATLRDPRVGTGDWRLQLQSPLAWRFAQGRLVTGSGQATLTAPVRTGPAQARLAWDPIRVGRGELQSTGRLSGLPMAWLALVGQVPPTGDLVFDGQWDARLGQALHLRASLARASGDLSVLAETGEGKSTRVTAGVREARLTLDSDGEALTAVVRWDSERAGTLDGRFATRLSHDGSTGWRWPDDAPLSGRLQARLPRLAVWSLLAPPGWRLRGSLDADLTVAGTRAQPSLQGPVRADDLGLRSVVDGVALENGRLRARLDTRRLVIDELVLQGAAGGGQVRAAGEVAWVGGDAGLQARLTAQLAQLRASVRADRQVTVSGTATATLDKQAVALTGDLKVDRARIVLPDQTAPQLGDDVVVRNLPAGVTLRPGADRATSGGRALRIAVQVALGDDVRIQGRGLTARLRGSLDVSGTALAEPRLTGTVETVDGDYLAYGQRLDIERGVLRFTGPADNPALDVLAVRTNPQQRVGVQITGRAQSPVVRLYADPDLPDAEKLSWLVLGRSSAAGGAEAALVQQAAMSLLTQRSGTSGKGIAGRLGLDELSVRRDSAEGAAITLGKRFASNFYAAYDRSLAGALGTLRVFYDLTARLTVRAEAGDRSGVDLIYTLSYD